MNSSDEKDPARALRTLEKPIEIGGVHYGPGWTVFTIRTPWATGCPSHDDGEQPQNAESDVIFTPEAAAVLKTTLSRTRSLARKGVIPAFKVGKKEWRYSKRTLLEWMQKQAQGRVGVQERIQEQSSPKPSRTPRISRSRRDIPTDLSPEALRKAINALRKTHD